MKVGPASTQSSPRRTKPGSWKSATIEDLRLNSFHPRRWMSNCHLQTVLPSKLNRNFLWGSPVTQKEVFDLSNGCRVVCETVRQPNPAPALVAFHGMGGSSRSSYMQGLLHKAHQKGWNAFLTNLYDANPTNSPPRIFHSGSSREVLEITNRVVALPGITGVFVVGVSMGGNILLKGLGEIGPSAPSWLHGAALISPLADLIESNRMLEKPSNAFYRIYFVRSLKALVAAKADRYRGFLDLNSIAQVRTIREFDDHFTARLSGFADAFDYYRKVSCQPLLKQISVPTLILHSMDDPLLPFAPLVHPEVLQNPSLLVHLTDHGGHAGFLEQAPTGPDRAWAENRVVSFLGLLS